MAAYLLQDGKQAWRTPRDEIPSWPTPTICEGKDRAELVTHATKAIRGYDPLAGKELWRLTGNSEVTTPTPIVAHGLIFVTNGRDPPGASGGISLKEGETSNQIIAWSRKQGGPYTPTPIVYGEYLYTCSNNGVLACYNAKTGERMYQQRLGNGGAYSASPVAADGKIYVVKAGPHRSMSCWG